MTVDGVKHLVQSFRLLYLNSKIGYKIAIRILKGENVSVIDRNRLRRALADIFLMLPFSAFIIIPGMELTSNAAVSRGIFIEIKCKFIFPIFY